MDKVWYYQMVTDCWRLFTKYAGMAAPHDDDFWEAFIKESREVYMKYNNNTLCSRMLCAMQDEVAEQDRRSANG